VKVFLSHSLVTAFSPFFRPKHLLDIPWYADLRCPTTLQRLVLYTCEEKPP
jgi:hypothetical protein